MIWNCSSSLDLPWPQNWIPCHISGHGLQIRSEQSCAELWFRITSINTLSVTKREDRPCCSLNRLVASGRLLDGVKDNAQGTHPLHKTPIFPHLHLCCSNSHTFHHKSQKKGHIEYFDPPRPPRPRFCYHNWGCVGSRSSRRLKHTSIFEKQPLLLQKTWLTIWKWRHWSKGKD